MRFTHVLMRVASRGVPQVLGVLLFLGGAGIGVTLLLSPNAFTQFPIFDNNFHTVSPVAWGTAFLAASLALVVSVMVDTARAQLPALMLGGLYIAFGLLTLGVGVSPVVWPFTILGWISVFTQILCWAEERRESLQHYKPY